MRKILRSVGYGAVSLDVENSKKKIKLFYEKLGFVFKSVPHEQFWIDKDSNKEIKLNVFYLRKNISDNLKTTLT